MSEIRANSITDAAGTGAPNFPNGLSGSGASLTNLPAPTSAQVGTATAELAAGAVGSYAFLQAFSSTVVVEFGDTVAGSALYAAGLRAGTGFTGTISKEDDGVAKTGTWRCMGYGPYSFFSSTSKPFTLFLRIS
jgi:hypothetical protein